MAQYIVTYKDQTVLEHLFEQCAVTYYSVVVNIAFVDTVKSKGELMQMEGVMSANPTRVRLYSNKRKEGYFYGF